MTGNAAQEARAEAARATQLESVGEWNSAWDSPLESAGQRPKALNMIFKNLDLARQTKQSMLSKNLQIASFKYFCNFFSVFPISKSID